MEQRISLITLGVRDISRARAFSDALGWSGQTSDGEVVFYQAGGMIFALRDRGNLAADSKVDDSTGWGGVTLVDNCRSEPEVDQVMNEARRAGAAIGREPARTVWGGYSGIFVDPGGHPWEVAHNPGWTIGDDGSVHL